MPTSFPSKFPTDSSPFLKIIESPLNLQILFYMTIYGDLTVHELSIKMRYPNKDTLLAALERMEQMGLIENYTLDGEIRYKTPRVGYQSKEYKDFKDFDTEKLREHLNEEFLYSFRTISLMKSIFGKLIHYICDFYINRMQSATLDPDILKEELKYDTAVPRIGFVSRDEFEIYKKRFNEFETSFIKEHSERRKSLGTVQKPDIEYFISNLFIPIKKVMDHK